MSTATKQKQVLKIGLDLGTNTTVFQASKNGKKIDFENDVIRTLVGYPKPGILPGILPQDAEVVFGEVAVNYRLHLSLKWPLKDGHIEETKTCRDFLGHIRELVNAKGDHEIWAVIGTPANTTPEKLKLIRGCVAGLFERIVVVPEPFLAAMGLREESRLGDPEYVDPTRHSLVVDIGAGTTDLCLVQGYYPTPEDQVSHPVAGDAVDNALNEAIRRRWPDLKLTRVTVTQLKEKYSFVNSARKEAKVKLYADGKPRMLDIADLVRDACGILVPVILEGIKELLKRCDSDSVAFILQNVILCGGGSAVLGLSEQVQTAMRAEGYDDTVCMTPPDYQRLVAQGALKVAEGVRDDQWQLPM
jgi:rod shape-determining protein MreB